MHGKSPLTSKQEGHLDETIKHCTACGEVLSFLRKIGVPNEALEEQNAYVLGTVQKAKELVEEYKNNPPQ